MIPLLLKGLPWRLIGLAVLCAGCVATGWKANDWRRDSQELAIQQAAEKAGERATTAAVDAIGKIRIQRVTVRQELEREIRFAPVGPECDLSDGMFNALNKALAPPGDSPPRVPGPDPAD